MKKALRAANTVKKAEVRVLEVNPFRVLLDPSRLAIVTVLYQVGRAQFRYLQKRCVFTAGNLSRHLSKLEAAGYVAMEKGFRENYPITVCSLTSKGRKALESCARDLSRVAGTARG